jgi:hypothetical protein
VRGSTRSGSSGTIASLDRHKLRVTREPVPGMVEPVQPTTRHEQVELRFRRLVDDAGLASPDRVDYVQGSVIFYWDGPRVAVYVDFDRE